MDGVAVTSGETGCWLRVCVEQPHDAERVERVSERDWGGGGREKEGKVAKGDDCGGGQHKLELGQCEKTHPNDDMGLYGFRTAHDFAHDFLLPPPHVLWCSLHERLASRKGHVGLHNASVSHRARQPVFVIVCPVSRSLACALRPLLAPLRSHRLSHRSARSADNAHLARFARPYLLPRRPVFLT